jgi:hypothetical protein
MAPEAFWRTFFLAKEEQYKIMLDRGPISNAGSGPVQPQLPPDPAEFFDRYKRGDFPPPSVAARSSHTASAGSAGGPSSGKTHGGKSHGHSKSELGIDGVDHSMDLLASEEERLRSSSASNRPPAAASAAGGSTAVAVSSASTAASEPRGGFYGTPDAAMGAYRADRRELRPSSAALQAR